MAGAHQLDRARRCGAALTALAFMALAPAAHAQVPGVTDAVGEATTSGNTGTSLPGTDTTTGPVNDTVDAVDKATGGAASDTTKTVTDTVNDTTSTVDDASGGTVTKVTDTVNDASGSLDQTINETGDKVGGAIDGVRESIDGNDGTSGPGELPARKSKKAVRRLLSSGPGDARRALTDDQMRAVFQQLGKVAFEPTPAVHAVNGATALPAEAVDSFVQRFAEGAARVLREAIQNAQFPLALTLAVIGFLMIQGRVDAKDPKLAFAPVDREQDFLAFQ